MPVYSFSQIQTFVQCPLKYRYKYVDKIKLKDFEETADLLLGKAVHFGLEKFYNDINNFKNPTKAQLLKYYFDYFDGNLNDKVVIKGEGTFGDFRFRGEQYLNNYFDKYLPKSGLKVVSTESNIYFNIDDNIKFQGFIDRLDKDGNDFIINDYKTNKNLPTNDKQEYIEQLTLYGLGIRQQYGKYLEKIYARLYFLHFDIVDSWEITDEILQSVVEKYRGHVNAIEGRKFAYNLGDKSAFEANENSLCKYCEYYSMCPLYVHLSYDDEKIEGLSDKTIKSLVDEYCELSEKMKDIKGNQDMIKDVLLNYVEGKDLKKLYGLQGKITIGDTITYSIEDKEKLCEILKKIGKYDETLDIDKSRLTTMIKEGKISLNDLGGSFCKNISKRFNTGSIDL